ncbi:MAG: hypothetical protein FD134_1217 [Gallionellaceae bacterium]|nr:MAG: hypothetical protein FD134_1217 [Gallionellaceae bacterium]
MSCPFYDEERSTDKASFLRYVAGLIAAVLVVILLVLPDESEAAVGFLWRDNCYASIADAQRAFFEEQSVPQYFSDPAGTIYKRNVQYASNTRVFYENMYTVNPTTGAETYLWSRPANGFSIFDCTIPDNVTGLAGNGNPSVFSPLYETARTVVNTQVLMIFLWVVATFLLGFKFGYFVFNSGGGKHDTF